jgi:hypothetical protein
MAALVGGGSGWLWTTLDLTGADAVASFAGDRDANGFSVKRVTSELQPTVISAIPAKSTGRHQGSERRGSATQRIGLPIQTHKGEAHT